MLYEKREKEEFIKHMNSRHDAALKTIKIVEDIVIPVLREFDRKVFNKKIVQAMETRCDDKLVLFSIVSCTRNHCDFGGIKVMRFVYPGSYIIYDSIIIEVDEDDFGEYKSYRINAKDTIANPELKGDLERLRKNAEDYADAIKNYDANMKLAEEIYEKIEQIRTLNWYVRNNLEFNNKYLLN